MGDNHVDEHVDNRLQVMVRNDVVWLLRDVEMTLLHSARVIHSTSHSDVALRGRPTFGPYDSFADVLLRIGIRRMLFYVCDKKGLQKTFICSQSRVSAQRRWASCRVGFNLVWWSRIHGDIESGDDRFDDITTWFKCLWHPIIWCVLRENHVDAVVLQARLEVSMKF